MATLENVVRHIFECHDFDVVHPEIVVVFDGKKSDEFLKWEQALKRYLCDDRIVLLETGAKKGASGARNVGIDHSRGEVLAFIGDDTYPVRDWLKRLVGFYESEQAKKKVLLGKVSWEKELATDPFHQWLEHSGQFAYDDIRINGPTWNHFYTSNVSLRRDFLGEERFCEDFGGWGFEDTELGYRLHKKGMDISFLEALEVHHDHRQTLDGFLAHTRNARKNAALFESLHPDLKILPEHRRKFGIKVSTLLKGGILGAKMVERYSDRIKWWRMWKQAWISQ